MRHKTLEAGVRNCGQNGGVVQFLAGVQIVAPRIATSVKVRDRSDCTLDRADHVALHYLHVIDVVQQPHARCACQRAHLQSPGGVVSLISRVVHAAVEQLQQQRYAGSRCCPGHARKAGCRDVRSLRIRCTVAAAAKANQVWNAPLRGQRYVGAQLLLDARVLVRPVQAQLN